MLSSNCRFHSVEHLEVWHPPLWPSTIFGQMTSRKDVMTSNDVTGGSYDIICHHSTSYSPLIACAITHMASYLEILHMYIIADRHDLGPHLWPKLGIPWPKLFFLFRGYMGLYSPVTQTNVTFSFLGHPGHEIQQKVQICWQAPFRTPLGAKIGAAWGSKLFFIFRGHMELYHPVVPKKCHIFPFWGTQALKYSKKCK